MDWSSLIGSMGSGSGGGSAAPGGVASSATSGVSFGGVSINPLYLIAGLGGLLVLAIVFIVVSKN